MSVGDVVTLAGGDGTLMTVAALLPGGKASCIWFEGGVLRSRCCRAADLLALKVE